MEYSNEKVILEVSLNSEAAVNTGVSTEADEMLRFSVSGVGGVNHGSAGLPTGNPDGGPYYWTVYPEGVYMSYGVEFRDINAYTQRPENLSALKTAQNYYDQGLPGGFVLQYNSRLMGLLYIIVASGQNPNTNPGAILQVGPTNRSSTVTSFPAGDLWMVFNDYSGLYGDNYGKFQVVAERAYQTLLPDLPEIDEVELDREICREATGSLSSSTEIIISGNAKEQRNSNQDMLQRMWRVMWVARSYEDKFRNLVAFFEARKGKAYGFRFFDWTDNSDWDNGVIEWNESNQAYQMYKLYPDNIRANKRPIYKPIAGTIQVFDDNIEVFDCMVDPESGEIAFVNGYEPNLPLTWTGSFDIPARFDSDRMVYKVTPDQNVIWDGMDILELI